MTYVILELEQMYNQNFKKTKNRLLQHDSIFFNLGADGKGGVGNIKPYGLCWLIHIFLSTNM